MTIKGYATLEGTARYRERFAKQTAPNHFRLEQNMWLSSIGIGTYLGNWDENTDERYKESVMRAVALGANLIDTAANYRFQRSERAIGAALRQLVEDGTCTRDEIVVCTKGGYLPFDSEPPADVRSYIEETFVQMGIAGFSDFVAGSHCMKPSYLQSQIDQSLDNMNLDCIDLYYIHNPETQLGIITQEEFEARLRAAFERMEENIAAGKIRHYGVATWNGFRSQPNARGYHTLERMVELAREAGGDDHGFRFIQLPFNLGMPEALLLANQPLKGEPVSLLEAAGALGITVIASASILQGKVAHNLSEEIREPLGSLSTDAQTAIQFVRSTPGITTALVGMSNRAHVEENLQLARVAPTLPEDYQRLFEQNQ
jgi:aryl-alcohol dehydrogenase-like predicted oxidoreductase